MKQLTSYNRVAGYLNKVFDILNEEFFESELSRPTITIQSTPKAYGHFSLREDTWVSKIGGTHEINIGAGTLSRPIEEVFSVVYCGFPHETEGFGWRSSSRSWKMTTMCRMSGTTGKSNS